MSVRSRTGRLDKILAQAGLGTRSEIRKAVRAGRALVNGRIEKDAGRQIGLSDEILFDGKKIGQEAHVYYMLHKPAGVITATEDPDQKTVLDLLRRPVAATEPVRRRDLFPVGRLDKDTEGLLLITDDGQLAHRLLAPGRHVDKEYFALVTGQVTGEDVDRFARGIQVPAEGSQDGFTALPARLEILEGEGCAAGSACSAESVSRVLVTIQEGKYHQIRRMFAALGREVLYLKRLSMGPLRLDPALSAGEFRPLRDEEVEALRPDTEQAG